MSFITPTCKTFRAQLFLLISRIIVEYDIVAAYLRIVTETPELNDGIVFWEYIMTLPMTAPNLYIVKHNANLNNSRM